MSSTTNQPDWCSSGSDDEVVAQLTDLQWSLRLYVQSLLPGDSASSDVAQQANATIWRKRADFESGTNFKAWAFAIARFEVLNYRKKQARERLTFGAELEEALATEFAERSEEMERRQRALRTCLAKLREKDRVLLLHRYGDTGTLADFAQASGRSVGGLKVTLHRLRSTLLQCIQRQLSGTERSAEG